jgi:hypothetical protein
MNQKLKYTGWHYLIGIIGLAGGASVCIPTILMPIAIEIVNVRVVIFFAFLLVSAILFFAVKSEMTYLMYTGMFAMLSILRTAFPTPYTHMGYHTFISLMYWLCLAYLIYKYLDFKGTFAKAKTIENLKAEFFKYFDRYSKENKENTNSKSQTTYDERTSEQREEEHSKSWYYKPSPYYYRVLGVGRGATPEEIKGAYRGLVKMYHPDLSDDPDTEQKFKEIKKAYKVLSDPDKRAQYDRFEDSYSE